MKRPVMALLTPILTLFTIKNWYHFKEYTKRWPPALHIVAAIFVALLAGITMLHATGLLEDFISIFRHFHG